jgi:hypothetical protein
MTTSFENRWKTISTAGRRKTLLHYVVAKSALPLPRLFAMETNLAWRLADSGLQPSPARRAGLRNDSRRYFI